MLRHAEAAPAPAGSADHERALTPRGQAQARGVGAWLAAQSLRPDRVMCSSARRARATATQVLAAWTDAPPVTGCDAIYEATPGALLALLQRDGSDERVLLVGHNPGVQQLVLALCTTLPGPFNMAPATLARIVLDGPLAPGHGHLAAWRTP